MRQYHLVAMTIGMWHEHNSAILPFQPITTYLVGYKCWILLQGLRQTARFSFS